MFRGEKVLRGETSAPVRAVAWTAPTTASAPRCTQSASAAFSCRRRHR